MSENNKNPHIHNTKKIGILTSGGDAPGMNAAINAVYKEIRYINFTKEKAREKNISSNDDNRKWELMLIKDGYRGLVNGAIFPVTEEWQHLINVSAKTGGTIIGSARFDEFKNESSRVQAKAQLDKFGIEVLIAIGGDGTFKGLLKMSDLGIQCIGIPGTIDNDVRTSDDTIGFDTALNTVVKSLDSIRETSDSHGRIAIVEVMGNRCGDLAIYAGPNADIVSTTELKIEEHDLIATVKDLRERFKLRSVIVLVTENLYDVHKLADKIQQQLQVETRATVLGATQRGGSPSARDRYLATSMGRIAVDQLNKSKTSCVIGLREGKMHPVPIPDAVSFEDKSRKNDSIYNGNQRQKVIKLLNLSGIVYKEEKKPL